MAIWSIRKLTGTVAPNGGQAQYSIRVAGDTIDLNMRVGSKISLRFSGQINCIHCDRSIKKSFNQGYCFPCAKSLAACDVCIVRPELCHFDKGSCREPAWGEQHCMIPHTVYLAISSGLKIGITRSHQRLNRWVDQGASFALPVLQVRRRLDAGIIESSLKSIFDDKTNWRLMLKNDISQIDLREARARLLDNMPSGIDYDLEHQEPIAINYPVNRYPSTITSIGFDKRPEISGELHGIKGQYLILDCGVINIRKHQGYAVELAFA